MTLTNRWQALFLLLGALLVGGCRAHEYAGTVLEPPKPLEDFSLPDASGGTFRLSDYRGRFVLVYFGYTFCPDICPATLLEARDALRALGEDAGQVQVVMVSVDPERDTPAHLSQYLANFDPSFTGLRTTDPDALEAVLADFGAHYEREEPAGGGSYLVTHTASLFLVDREGRLREVFGYGTPGEAIAADLRQLMRE